MSNDTRGWIGYLGLGTWWTTTFTASEREYIESVFKPLGFTENLLTGREILSSSQSAGQLLGNLAGWFKKEPNDYDLAKRLLAKAEECAVADGDLVSLHFIYGEAIQVHYRRRNDYPGALDAAIAACRQQIALAPNVIPLLPSALRLDYLPAHRGFEQLAIVLEKARNYEAAIEISREALKQRWTGDWKKRIERCEKRNRQSVA